MPRTKLIRRQPATFTPMFPTPFLSRTLSPLTATADELLAQADEMMRAAFGTLPIATRGEWFPAVNVSETKDELTITAELPGMSAKDISVDYTDGVLTIKGEKEQETTKEEEERRYYMWERRFGSFQRSLPFPGGIADDKIAAEFKDGVLTVHLPKTEEVKAAPHAIPITEK